MTQFLLICLGGAAGNGTRHLVALWAAGRFGTGLPYGTLIVNLAGCFAIAAVVHAALTLGWPETVRLAITVGFLGGLTTYSSFNHETLRLLTEGAPARATVYFVATVAGCGLSGILGLLVARAALGR